MVAQAGKTKRAHHEAEYRGIPFGVQGRGGGEATLIIPAAKRIKETMRMLLKLRSDSPTTSALLLLPEDYINSDEIKTFLHAYCQRGEVYRYGNLFRRSTETNYMHLNQAVTEFWFDGENAHLAALSPQERRELEETLKEFEDVIGDEFDRNKQPKTVPYVRATTDQARLCSSQSSPI